MTKDTNTDLTPDINAELTPADEITIKEPEDHITFDYKVEKLLTSLVRPDIEKQFVYHLTEYNEYFQSIGDFNSDYIHCSVYRDLFKFIKDKVNNGIETSILMAKEYFLRKLDKITAEEEYNQFTSGIQHSSKKKMKGYATDLAELYCYRLVINNNTENYRDCNYDKIRTLNQIIDDMVETAEQIRTIINPAKEIDFSSGFLALGQSILDGTFKDRHSSGMSSGFTKLDKITGGFHPGELTTIGAKTGFGKTTFTINIACNMLKILNKKRNKEDPENIILFYAMEMDEASLQKRILTNITDTTLDNFNKDTLKENKILAVKASEELARLGLAIRDKPAITINDIKSDLMQAKKQNYAVKAVFVDYLQKMEIENSNPNKKTEEITKISDELKQLALREQIPVISIAQFNRGFSNREDPTPENTDFKNSSSIEQDSDITILMYQKHKTKAKTDNPDPCIMKDDKIIIRVSKNRHGEEGIINMIFNRDKLRFIEDGYDL